MSDNQQPFSPPLTAEERALWDHIYTKTSEQHSTGTSADFADGSLRERRRRFGAPSPTVPVEVDVLRAEVETLTKEHTALRAVAMTRTQERNDISAEVERLTKDAQVRENVYRIRCEQVDALVSRAEKAEKERDEARDQYRDVVTKLEQCSDSLGPINRELASMRARAEKAEAELAALKTAQADADLSDELVTEWERDSEWMNQGAKLEVSKHVAAYTAKALREGLAAKRELAAARPVLEAVVNFAWGPYADAVLAKELLVNYSNAQRAARAAKEWGAS